MFLTAVLLFPSTRARASSESDPVIRILLSVGITSRVEMQIGGSYECFGSRFTGGILYIEADGTELRVRHSTMGLLGSGTSAEIKPADDAAGLSLNNSVYGERKYLGSITCSLSQENVLRVVNTVGINEYLYGVLDAELSDDTNPEALKARAVAAKCYALSCRNSVRSFDISDRDIEVSYTGFNPGHTNIIAAVDEVSQNLLLSGGTVTRCYCCTSNGGYTILPSMRWDSRADQDVSYASRFDPFDLEYAQTAVFQNIDADISKMNNALYNILILKASGENISSMDSIVSVNSIQDFNGLSGSNMESDTAEPAYMSLTVACTLWNGTAKYLSFLIPLSELFEKQIIQAPDANVCYVLQTGSETWTVICSRKIGHRVGMSKYGMLQRAESGQTYDQILSFYYPGAELVKAKKIA